MFSSWRNLESESLWSGIRERTHNCNICGEDTGGSDEFILASPTSQAASLPHEEGLPAGWQSMGGAWVQGVDWSSDPTLVSITQLS